MWLRHPTLMRLPLVGICASALCVAAGCGGGPSKPSATVSGEVLFEGKPVEAGMVNFESPATGMATQAPLRSGSFQFPQPVPLGSYKVSIAPPPDPPPVPGQTQPPADPKDIPKKYRSITTSDLTAEVKSGGAPFKFELKP
jgi:hypothetical protein